MYLGVNIGPPTVWEFNLIPGDAGALSQEVVVNIGTPENPNTSSWVRMTSTFTTDLSLLELERIELGRKSLGLSFQSRSGACKALHDKKNSLVYFYYPTSDTLKPNSCRVYNYRTDRWGVDNRQIEATVDFMAPAVTYDGIGALYATYADLPNLSYDAAFVGATQVQPAIFTTGHVLNTLTGPAGTTNLTTG
jgi:hypothetical protein